MVDWRWAGIVTLLVGAAGGGEGGGGYQEQDHHLFAELLKPCDGEVWRRQSVEVELRAGGFGSGFGVLEIDGRHLHRVISGHLSLILSDEKIMSDGVHTLRLTLFDAHGSPLVRLAPGPSAALVTEVRGSTRPPPFSLHGASNRLPSMILR
eukprot:768821-Hanusia_phi.AAC.3